MKPNVEYLQYIFSNNMCEGDVLGRFVPLNAPGHSELRVGTYYPVTQTEQACFPSALPLTFNQLDQSLKVTILSLYWDLIPGLAWADWSVWPVCKPHYSQ